MEQIFLSRRNLMILLAKLDRVKEGGASACTIIKYQNPDDPFVQSIDAVRVTAVEDEELYTGRAAGTMHPNDEVTIATEIYGKVMGRIKPGVHTSDSPAPDNEGNT